MTSLSVVVAAISINDPLLTLVALGMLAEAISYSLWLKTIPFLGNISVAFQVACAFAYGVFMAGGQVHQEIPILSGIFLGYLNFELAKTASDRWHDQLFIKTAATTLRPKGMWMLLVGLSLAHLSLMFAFALANADPSRSVALLGLPTVPLLGYLLYARKSHDTDSIERSIQISKKTFVPVLLILLLQGWLV